MTGDTLEEAENPFWTFSLTVYARDGVAPACLRLQDRFGADVNLLLYCCWAARRGHAIDDDLMSALIDLTAGWSREVVQPLRGIRRALKGGFGSMTEETCAPLRRDAAALELEAERLEQNILAAALPEPGTSTLAERDLAAANLARYFAARDTVIDGEAAADIDTLREASLAAAD